MRTKRKTPFQLFSLMSNPKPPSIKKRKLGFIVRLKDNTKINKKLNQRKPFNKKTEEWLNL